MNPSPIKQSSSSVLELSMMFLVGSIDSVAAPMFPNKQIHADPEGCPTIAELLPLK